MSEEGYCAGATWETAGGTEIRVSSLVWDLLGIGTAPHGLGHCFLQALRTKVPSPWGPQGELAFGRPSSILSQRNLCKVLAQQFPRPQYQ